MPQLDRKKLINDIWRHVKLSKGGTVPHDVNQTERLVRIYTSKYRGNTMISLRAAIDWLESNKDKEEIPEPFNLAKKTFGKNKEGINLVTFDHTHTVKEFSQEIMTCKSKEEVEQKLEKYPGLCIITDEENKCLSTHGFMSYRKDVGGWKEAYAKPPCEIVIMNKKEAQEFKKNLESFEKQELMILASLHKNRADFKKFNPRAYRSAESFGPLFMQKLKYSPQDVNYKVRDDKFFNADLGKEVRLLKNKIRKVENEPQFWKLSDKYAELLKKYPSLPDYYRRDIEDILNKNAPPWFKAKP